MMVPTKRVKQEKDYLWGNCEFSSRCIDQKHQSTMEEMVGRRLGCMGLKAQQRFGLDTQTQSYQQMEEATDG